MTAPTHPQRFVILVAVCILSSAIAQPAWAQPGSDERGLIPGLGFQYARNSHEDASLSFPVGLILHVERDLIRQPSRAIGFAAQVGLGFGSEQEFDQRFRLVTALGGPQVTWRGGPVHPFLRVLAGLAALHASATFNNTKVTDTSRAFEFAGEGGIETQINAHTVEVGVRVGRQFYSTPDLDFGIFGLIKVPMSKFKKK